MKKGKKPTVAQKMLLKKNRLDPEKWLIERIDYKAGEMKVVNRASGNLRKIKLA